MRFFDVFDIISDLMNGTKTSCDDTIINHFELYQYGLIPAVFLTLLLASTKTRRQCLVNWLQGRPGLLSPMDTLSRENRLAYCTAFGITAFSIYELLLGQKLVFDYQGPACLLPLVALLTMFVYGLIFFPVFACIALSSAFSYGLGSFYVWVVFALDVYEVAMCNLTQTGRMVMVLRALPSLACSGYLSVTFPLRFLTCCYKRDFFPGSGPGDSTKETLSDIKISHQGLHVRKLLRKPELCRTKKDKMRAGRKRLWNFFQSWIYHREPGFRYPAQLLSVMFVAFCVVFMITVDIFFTFLELFDTAIVYTKSQEESNVEIDLSVLFLLRTSFIVSIVATCVFTLLNILHTLSSFRSNVFALYRGQFTAIPPSSKRQAVSLCTGSLNYTGYQVAYVVWGHILVLLILFLVSSSLALLFDQNFDWLILQIQDIWPGVVVALVLMVVQTSLAKFVFLQTGGEHVALRNRTSYFIFAYFMFFYNTFLGVLSCLMRMLKAIAVGAFFLARLDSSTLPRNFEKWDPGLNAYIGYIHMMAAHTHPVLDVFIRLLASLPLERTANSPSVSLELSGFHLGDTGSGDIPRTERLSSSNKEARSRWFLVYTLLHNPQIRVYRKGCVQAMERARQEGLTVPISDKTVSSLDLVQVQKRRAGNNQPGTPSSRSPSEYPTTPHDPRQLSRAAEDGVAHPHSAETGTQRLLGCSANTYYGSCDSRDQLLPQQRGGQLSLPI